ncbi:hypothetical protein D3C86_1136360 [compost metagenome]
MAAERHDDRAGQRRQVDGDLGVVVLVGVGEGVREDDAALGVGVDHLDRQALVALEDVAGAVGAGARHVVGARDAAHHVEGNLEVGERADGAEDRGGAGHVGLHLLHAACGLDAQAARIEGQALADQRVGLVARLAAHVLEDDEGGRLGGPGVDAEQAAEAHGLQLALAVHPAREAARDRHGGRLGGEVGRRQLVAGAVDEGAGPVDGLGDALALDERRFGLGGHGVEHQGQVRGASGLGGAAALVEGVEGKLGALRHGLDQGGRIGPGEARERRALGLEVPGGLDAAAGRLSELLEGRFGALAEAEQHQALDPVVAFATTALALEVEGEGLVEFRLEVAERQQIRDRAAEGRVDRLGGGREGLIVLVEAEDEGVDGQSGCGAGVKLDIHVG